MSFDLSPGQKAFITGLWLGSLALTGLLCIADATRHLVHRRTPCPPR